MSRPAICVLAFLLAASCGSGEENTAGTLSVSGRIISLDAQGTPAKVTVTSGMSWVVETESDWVHVSPEMLRVPTGTVSEKEVTVSAEPNPDAEIREGRFKISTHDADVSLIVIQAASEKQPEVPDTDYTNPLTTSSWADPTIWGENGVFYTYSTMGSSVKQMLTSTDLVHWTSASAPFSTSVNSSLVAYGSSRWAPDVVKIGVKWMMYITCRNDTSSGIAALSANYPEGPFSLVGRITYSGNTGIKDSIDPEVVQDPETGKVWLFFGSTGKMHRVELNSSGTALAEGAKYVHVAGLDVNQNSARDKVFEGAYLYRRDGWWYLFASAAQYWNYTYKVVVGRSRTIDGEFLDRQGRKMTEGYSTPVISSADGDNFFGPGHNGEIFTDDKGRDFIFYHCHDKSKNNDDKRFLMLQQIFWDESGWPYVEGGKPCSGGVAPYFKNN